MNNVIENLKTLNDGLNEAFANADELTGSRKANNTEETDTY